MSAIVMASLLLPTTAIPQQQEEPLLIASGAAVAAALCTSQELRIKRAEEQLDKTTVTMTDPVTAFRELKEAVLNDRPGPPPSPHRTST